MKFQQLLANAIESSEIPLRFEPGATEAVAKPITGMLQAWISAHIPPDTGSEFDAGCAAQASADRAIQRSSALCGVARLSSVHREREYVIGMETRIVP